MPKVLRKLNKQAKLTKSTKVQKLKIFKMKLTYTNVLHMIINVKTTSNMKIINIIPKATSQTLNKAKITRKQLNFCF